MSIAKGNQAWALRNETGMFFLFSAGAYTGGKRIFLHREFPALASVSWHTAPQSFLSQNSSQGITGKTLLFILVGITASLGWATSCYTEGRGLATYRTVFLVRYFLPLKINLFSFYKKKFSILFLLPASVCPWTAHGREQLTLLRVETG